MKSRTKELVDRAIAANVSAIEIYNKPDFRYRAETFCILAVNGWELLFKAKWLVENNNRINSLYVKYADQKKDGSKSKKLKIKRTKSGNPFTHNINYLGKKLLEKGHLNQNAWTNIKALLDLRNSSVHFYNQSRSFVKELQGIGTASVKNFVALIEEWFKRDLSEFNFYLMPLSFMELPAETDVIVFNNEERNFLNYLTKLKMEEESDTGYSVIATINVEFADSKTDNTKEVRIVDSTNTDAPVVRIAEDGIFKLYSLDYKTLTKKCRSRYANFKENHKYHKLRKSICEKKKEQVYIIRQLDPKSPKSAKKDLFKPEILNEFDKYYTKHGE